MGYFFHFSSLYTRVTSLEQLSLAEFSGEYARSKVYETDHKDVLFGLIWYRMSNIAQFWFSKSFFYVKNWPNLSEFFFSLKNIKMGEQLLLMTYFDNFDF